ncbi:hypothetical protein GUITHDRAFT_112746 [Guillardia theta CCMP2712]|uniref:LysM domain-containing protein n=1 Tax=Guillardia theta (strain CCMP2712) TaxID=905079 RepID=L1IZI1_GUITC|nr:hypothetical protein GUITHDRAFT_112746 [Guillardia theta CCMP2712]EKX41284.1 hypothetical protein GUITHDRAFT_112746 [Guillardia theta CCMP2712]|eukprot:XP_005828264.1 hypothetical protein GUITHDRAFT_112746 [Guillardia theta CCMP2712]
MNCNLVALVVLTTCIWHVDAQSYQYRGGSINWLPNPAGSNYVQIIIHTVWTQPPGSESLKVEDVVPFRSKSSTPPLLIISNGVLHQELQVVVASVNVKLANTLEGISVVNVSLPLRSRGYIAEVQGCCRESPVSCDQTGSGLSQYCGTKFFLRTLVKLDRDPPPFSYLPFFFPYDLPSDPNMGMILPIVDFRLTYAGINKVPMPEPHWPKKIQDRIQHRPQDTSPPILNWVKVSNRIQAIYRAIQNLTFNNNLNQNSAIVINSLNQNSAIVNNSLNQNSTIVNNSLNQNSTSFNNSNLTTDHSLQDGLVNISLTIDLLLQDGFTPEEAFQVMEVYDTNKDSIIEGEEIRIQEALKGFDVVPSLPKVFEGQTYETIVKVHSIGGSVPMLGGNESETLMLYQLSNCSGYSAPLPPGADICRDSFVEFSSCPDGSAGCYKGTSLPVVNNFQSLQIPAGFVVDIVYSCEVSQTDFSSYHTFSEGSILQTCDGSTSTCCNLKHPAASLTFRTINRSIASSPQEYCQGCTSNSEDIATMLTFNQFMSHYTGVYETKMSLKSTLLPVGNYPVLMQIQSATSAYTFIEFILHKMTGSQFSIEFYSDLQNEPAFFFSSLHSNSSWTCTQGNCEASLQLTTNLALFTTMTYNNDTLQNRTESPTIQPDSFLWTPCYDFVGMHYFCLFWGDSTSGQWTNLKCIFIRVIENLPPKIHVNISNTTSEYLLDATAYMGQKVHIVLALLNQYQSRFKYSGISQIFMNNGESAFARTTYRAAKVGSSRYYIQEFVNATPPKIVNIEWTPIRNILINEGSMEISGLQDYYLKPNYMNSGLNITVCFMVINEMGTDGQCGLYGPWTEHCIRIDVLKCKYSLSPGQSLVHIAGLFKTNWIQLYSLNPHYTRADAIVVNNSVVVDIGKLYNVSFDLVC